MQYTRPTVPRGTVGYFIGIGESREIDEAKYLKMIK
jgi:hypothetical protein